ncbi:MAG: hypothetical protein QOH37_3400, partial [Nocardioidaceae bacterium]|nr:hypothetical protein [Nocardioidaceae bacterium]
TERFGAEVIPEASKIKAASLV